MNLHRWQRQGKRTLHYGFLILLALFTTYPFWWTLTTAVGTEGNVFAFPPALLPQAPSWANFKQVIDSISIGAFFKNSLWISFWTVFWTLAVSATAAYPLARLTFRGRNVVFYAIVATLMLPTEVNFLPNFIILTKFDGGLRALADATGWDWLTAIRFTDAHLGVVLPNIATAFGIFLMKQAFEEIPQDLLDAARVDGATEVQIFWRVCLPLTLPHLATLAIFTLVTSWNSFLWPGVVLKSPDSYPLSVGVLYLQGAFQSSFRLVAAGAVITILPVLGVFVFTQRYFMRGLDGAVK